MAKKRVDPRKALADNINALLEIAGIKAPTLAARTGVDRKTINNYVNQRRDFRAEKVDKIARHFHLAGGQLLMPLFDLNATPQQNRIKLREAARQNDASQSESATVSGDDHVIEMRPDWPPMSIRKRLGRLTPEQRIQIEKRVTEMIEDFEATENREPDQRLR